MIGEIFYDDENYSVKAEWCNNNNCHIEEIEKDEKGRRFKIVENVITEEELANNEIQDLKEWFEKYYSQHEQKYNRLIALERECDDGSDPADKLIELYKQAESYRKRIQNLEEMLKENENAIETE